MLFHTCSKKNSCFSELVYNTSVFVLNDLQFEIQKRRSYLKNIALDFALDFEAMLHPSCYLTSIMDETHHGPVIALFSAQLQQLFQLRRWYSCNQPFFTVIG